MSKPLIEIPADIYTSDKACAEFIFDMNQRQAKIIEIEKAVKAAKEIAT